VKDDLVYLAHILECINRVEQYCLEGREAFFASTLIQDAVLRNLQTLTEAAQRLGAEMKERLSDVNWTGMSGFRNRLVHDYLAVDLTIVWEIVEQYLPDLKGKLSPVLKEIERPRTTRRKKSPADKSSRPTKRKK
jgi:uncharacterized protein with HEPN domain